MATFAPFNPVQDFQRGRQNALTIQGQEQGIAREASAAPIRDQLSKLGLQETQKGITRSDAQNKRTDTQNEQSDSIQKMTILNNVSKALAQLPEQQRAAAFSALEPELAKFGIDTAGIKQTGFSDAAIQQAINTTQGFLKDPDKRAQLTSKQREFESQTEGFSDADKLSARRISVGLDPRAVGSAIQTITESGTAEDIGESEAIIGERKKFGELTAASRSKAIDSGFERITGINKNIENIDRALSALERGAGTGAAERFFPSIKAATVELDQIQGELALDVIGAVTFGALSKGELDLAREIALPTGLNEPELIDFLGRKKVAQEKLRDYFSEQIQFLDQGGTVAGFLRSKEREQPEQAAQQAPQTSQFQEGQTAINAQGQRIVFQNGQWVDANG